MVCLVRSRSGLTSVRGWVAVTLLAGLAIGAAAAQLPSVDVHKKKHDLKRQVEALEERWRTAQLAGDVATIDHMLSDDYIGISMTGQVNTKAQQLDRIRSRQLVLTKIDLDDCKVKVLEAVAIVTCKASVEGSNEGDSMKGTFRYTRVYQHVASGEWKITSFEATAIRPPKSVPVKTHGR
jgi:ketosteroid isomerase-like protein